MGVAVSVSSSKKCVFKVAFFDFNPVSMSVNFQTIRVWLLVMKKLLELQVIPLYPGSHLGSLDVQWFWCELHLPSCLQTKFELAIWQNIISNCNSIKDVNYSISFMPKIKSGAFHWLCNNSLNTNNQSIDQSINLSKSLRRI